MEQQAVKAVPDDPNIKRSILIGAITLALITLIALVLVFKFISDERERTLNEWQVRLSIVADSRVAALDDWLAERFKTLKELAENTSVQLYMTELAFAEAAEDEGANENKAEEDKNESQAQRGYLRNLLDATALRQGFHADQGPKINANIEQVGIAGLALVDQDGKAVTTSVGMPPRNEAFDNAITTALGGKPSLIDIHLGPDGKPAIGFAYPIYSLQGDEGDAGIGAIIGVAPLDQSFTERLHQPGETSKSAQSLLVRLENNSIRYLSSLSDGTPALKRTLDATNPNLASAIGLTRPGSFNIALNYAGTETLSVSRAIDNTPWVLIRMIDRDEALSDSERRLRTTMIVLILTVLGGMTLIVAIWRHGTSVKAAAAAESFKLTAERFENLLKFMRTLSDAQQSEIVAIDDTGICTFVNTAAAERAKMSHAAAVGKSLSGLLGQERAEALLEVNHRINEHNRVSEEIHHFRREDTHAQEVIKSTHVWLEPSRRRPPGVLMILDDITNLSLERERAERRLKDLIDTLVGVVDRRDPYSSNHSSHVAEVASEIASSMGLSRQEIDTVSTSGRLMNLGKIFIPVEILTKTGKLSPEEQSLLSATYHTSAELLSGVDFSGKVHDTIKQILERVDGTGPMGLKGDDILLTSRILSVANAFVGMLSPRAYRAALDFDQVIDNLQRGAGRGFDKRVVSALVHILENCGGMERWKDIRILQKVESLHLSVPVL